MKRRFWGFLSIQLVKTIAGKTADVGEVWGRAPVWRQEEGNCGLSAGSLRPVAGLHPGFTLIWTLSFSNSI